MIRLHYRMWALRQVVPTFQLADPCMLDQGCSVRGPVEETGCSTALKLIHLSLD